jgi:hypothetical protein
MYIKGPQTYKYIMNDFKYKMRILNGFAYKTHMLNDLIYKIRMLGHQI